MMYSKISGPLFERFEELDKSKTEYKAMLQDLNLIFERLYEYFDQLAEEVKIAEIRNGWGPAHTFYQAHFKEKLIVLDDMHVNNRCPVACPKDFGNFSGLGRKKDGSYGFYYGDYWGFKNGVNECWTLMLHELTLEEFLDHMPFDCFCECLSRKLSLLTCYNNQRITCHPMQYKCSCKE